LASSTTSSHCSLSPMFSSILSPSSSSGYSQHRLAISSWGFLSLFWLQCHNANFVAYHLLGCFLQLWELVGNNKIQHEFIGRTVLHIGHWGTYWLLDDRLCGLRSQEILVTAPEATGSVPGAARSSEKYWVWNGIHSVSWR
jgi:hypothetical protein